MVKNEKKCKGKENWGNILQSVATVPKLTSMQLLTARDAFNSMHLGRTFLFPQLFKDLQVHSNGAFYSLNHSVYEYTWYRAYFL